MSGRFEIKIAHDKSTATIKAFDESGAEVVVSLDSDKLLSLIKGLGAVHSKMIEGRPLPDLERERVDAVVNPRWYVSPQLMGEASALSFYHSAFGPVSFLVPIDQVERMISFLAKQVEIAKASRQGKGN
ncbi:MAG: hypothetical protein WBO09_21195 [Methylocystis silviterrae]